MPGESHDSVKALMRARGLVEVQDYSYHVPDFPALASFAEFDPTYLSMTREPR